jgi:hypothetical protein
MLTETQLTSLLGSQHHPTPLNWRYHDMDETRVRVWGEDWPNDMFDVLPSSAIIGLGKLGCAMMFCDD